MMNRVLIILLLLPVACLSQTNDRNKIYPHAILSGGITGGEKQAAPVAQLSAGISYGPWFSGLGVGLDNYRINSIPVFADWRFSFGPKRMLNVYVNGGYHFLKPTAEQFTENIWWGTKQDLKSGFFGEAGLGFQLQAGRYHRIGSNVGYRHKRMTQMQVFESLCQTCQEYTVKEIYGFSTIVFRLTWEIGR